MFSFSLICFGNICLFWSWKYKSRNLRYRASVVFSFWVAIGVFLLVGVLG